VAPAGQVAVSGGVDGVGALRRPTPCARPRDAVRGALSGELGPADERAGQLLPRGEAGVFDQRPCGDEPARVTSLGQDRGRAERGQSGDEGDQLAQLQVVEHGQHAGLGVGESDVRVLPVLEQQSDACERADAVRVNTRRVG